MFDKILHYLATLAVCALVSIGLVLFFFGETDLSANFILYAIFVLCALIYDKTDNTTKSSN